MKTSELFFWALLLVALLFPCNNHARKVETFSCLRENRTYSTAIDIHLTDGIDAISGEGKIHLNSEDAWLFFDNVKPNEVLSLYKDKILIQGRIFDPATNGRICIYKQGTIILPHSHDFCPFIAYSKKNMQGDSARFSTDIYYSNQPSSECPKEMVSSMQLDNAIHSFILKRGYMATLANEPNGLGYSRIFIADEEDLHFSELPKFLDGKISFVRVCKWQYPSKKGWAGSIWKEAPSGLKYVNEQCDFTNSTWYYNWGASTAATTNPSQKNQSYNQEYVPEKWGAGGSWTDVYSIKDVSHLMGYNEPDHSEQSNVSVERAIEEWPKMLMTGLRLGTPATTNFTWLYDFMREARKRNYRVDYVVIHAYWGGMSAYDWYNKLKAVHEQTGLPIWIKEWNNGANWTNEGWPSGVEAQQTKQLTDLKSILAVMDTAHFIERYSIYNWVEDKRAIILDGKLTPAGKFYAENQPSYFFQREQEFIPSWVIRESPSLYYSNNQEEHGNGVLIKWTDVNGEQICTYDVEQSFNGVDYELLDSLVAPNYSYYLPPLKDVNGRVYYRVKSNGIDGTKKYSNIVSVNYLPLHPSNLYLGELLITEKWTPAFLADTLQKNNIVLLGTPTFRNKAPLSYRTKKTSVNSFDYRLTTWEYQNQLSFVNPDTIGYFILPIGEYEWGSIKAEVGEIRNVTQEWKRVDFTHPFTTLPIVLTTQTSDRCPYSSSVRVKNVDERGFEVALQYEGFLRGRQEGENVSFLAATPGRGFLNDFTISVGKTNGPVVPDNIAGGYKQKFGEDFDHIPFFFGGIQTCEDTITAVLRIKYRDCSTVTLVKEREKSEDYSRVKPEEVGWLVIGNQNKTGIECISRDCKFFYDGKFDYLESVDGEIIRLKVFDSQGKIVVQTQGTKIPLYFLPKGVYFFKIDDKKTFKVLR